ncbi:MAG: efflux RND transporter permease subunit [Candidatus Limnocylindria bacterium]
MLRGVVASSVRFRLLVIGIAAALMLVGATQLRNARVDILPEFSPPYVEVQTEALGLSAEEVEELITVPLEADLLNGVAFLEEIRSESITGLSSIVMTFEPGTDIFKARQVVAERLTQAHALPNVSKPPAMLQPLSTENRVMMVSLRASDLSLIDMSVLARWNIRPRLMGVPGVANVSIWGERNRQLQVLVDPTELQEQGVTLGEVITTTGNALWVSPLTFLEASTPGTGGFIDTPNQRLGIQHVLPIRSAEDLARVVVETEDTSQRLRLGDIATVVEDHPPLIGDAVVGDGQGLLLVIEKFPGVNTLEVTRSIDEALAAMLPGLNGIQVDTTVFRPANFIEASIGNISLALLIGFLLIVLVLGALLFDWRAALISLVTIPLSLATAGLVLHFAGATLNVMVMAGLIVAIGVIVDDAATSVESVLGRLRRPQEGDEERTPAVLVTQAVLEGRRPILYATLVILLALVPVFFIGGTVSAFLPPLAIAYGVAVLASMAVTLTVAPALAVLLLPRGSAERRESPILSRLRGHYGAALSSLLHRRRPGLLTGGVAVLGVAALVGLLVVPQASGSASVLPSFKTNELLIHWDGAAGTSRPEMARIVGRATQELRTIPGVQNVDGHVGRAILSDAITDVSSGEIWLTIDGTADYDQTIAAIRNTVDGYPGLGRAIVTYPEERISEVLSGSEHDAVVRVYGHELSTLRNRAEAVRQAVAGVAGVVDASVLDPVEEAGLEVEVDLEAAHELGLKAGDVRRAATTLLSGIEVGLLFEEQKVFDVVVWGKPELRTSISSVENLMIETSAGDLVPLAQVSDVRIAPTPSVITRQGVRRIMEVGANISGRDVGSALRDIDAAVGAVEFPLEYHAEVFSEAADRQAAQTTLLAVLAGAAIMVFLLVQAVVASWRLAALVFVTLPTALVGGMLTGFAGGELVSIGTLAGLFAVLAISVRTSISLIDHFQKLERTGAAHAFGPQLVLAGAQDRLGPTLMTVLATAVGVVPFIVLGEVAGLEVVRPMAIFVLGGLITSTLLTLFVVPDIYMRSGPSPQAETETLSTEQPALEPTMA